MVPRRPQFWDPAAWPSTPQRLAHTASRASRERISPRRRTIGHVTELRVGSASIGQMRGKTGDRREAIDVCDGQVRSEAGFEVAMHLYRQQRVASQAEEVVVHAHTVDSEHALERVGDMLW